MERIISVTELTRNAARIAEEIEMEGTVFRVTRGGRGSMVLVDESYFDGWMAAVDEMRRSGWQERLSRVRREVAAKRGRSLDAIAKETELVGSVDRDRRAHAARASTRRRRPRR